MKWDYGQLKVRNMEVWHRITGSSKNKEDGNKNIRVSPKESHLKEDQKEKKNSIFNNKPFAFISFSLLSLQMVTFIKKQVHAYKYMLSNYSPS